MFFDWETFFEPRLRAVSLFFGMISRCYRFIKVCITDNPKLTDDALKSSFASLFRSTCPALLSHRWQYVFLGKAMVQIVEPS